MRDGRGGEGRDKEEEGREDIEEGLDEGEGRQNGKYGKGGKI